MYYLEIVFRFALHRFIGMVSLFFTALKWLKVFKGLKGTGEGIYSLWAGGKSSSSYDSTCNCHYKSPIVEKWNEYPIQFVSSLYRRQN
jgi:hypothetical protein